MPSAPLGVAVLTVHDAPAIDDARRHLSQRVRPTWGSLDGELLAFHAGLKRLVKRERLSAASAARIAASPWLAGATTRMFEGGAPNDVTLLAARDAPTLERAAAFEERERLSGGHRAEAIRWMGAELGYPPCCVEAFAQHPVHDDAAVLRRLLAPGTWNALPWLANPFVPGVSVVTHYPCRLDCPATAALGGAIFDHLCRVEPARADETRRLLTSPAVLFDRFALTVLEGGTPRGDDVTWSRAWLPLEGSPEALFSHTASARLFLTRVAPLFAAADHATFQPRRVHLSHGGRPLADLESLADAPPWRVIGVV